MVNYCPKRSDPKRIRLTVDSDCINYPGDCGTLTADIITVNILPNSVISTKGTKFISMDI